MNKYNRSYIGLLNFSLVSTHFLSFFVHFLFGFVASNEASFSASMISCICAVLSRTSALVTHACRTFWSLNLSGQTTCPEACKPACSVPRCRSTESSHPQRLGITNPVKASCWLHESRLMLEPMTNFNTIEEANSFSGVWISWRFCPLTCFNWTLRTEAGPPPCWFHMIGNVHLGAKLPWFHSNLLFLHPSISN